MKTQTHQKYLYKPKRIRKKKKDFLRGRVDNPKPSITSSESTPIPIPYILLFALLIATIIGYTSLSFLFGRIHINTAPVYNALINTVTSIKLPHSAIPSMHIPTPHIQIHISSLPIQAVLPMLSPLFNKTKQLTFFLLQQNLFWILSLITVTLKITIVMVTQQASTAFTTIVKAIVQLTTPFLGTLQRYEPSTLTTLNPLPIVQTNISILITTILTTTNILKHAFTWLRNNLVDYIGTLALWTKQGGVLSLELVDNLGLVLLAILTGIGTFVINTIITHITFILHLLFALVTLLVQGTLTGLLILARLLWEGIVTVWIMCEEIGGIAFQGIQTLISWIGFVITTLYHGLVFVFDSMLALFMAIITAIANCIQSIIMAIKRSLDNTIAAILAVIHLGDPIYEVIGQTIAAIFITTGQTLGVMKEMIQGGKL